MDMHTYAHATTSNTANSFSVVSMVKHRYCWKCIFTILEKKKRTLLFEQISTESRYETEVQETASSLIILTVFLKLLACVEVIEKEKMKHLSMHKNSFT